MQSRRISMKWFGKYGQWGNQVFQYMFLRRYAKLHNLRWEIPSWVGQHYYGVVDHPMATPRLPTGKETYEPCARECRVPIPPNGEEFVGRDWVGWGQFHTSWYAPDREFLQGLFAKIVPSDLSKTMSDAMEKLREKGKTVISLHLRRGDAGRFIFFLTPIVWCLKWLRANWKRFDSPVLYLATEEQSLRKWFEGYNVVMMEDLGFEARALTPPHYIYPHKPNRDTARQLTFLPDWHVMQHSDVVLIGESTFSLSAALMNQNIKEFWRARLSTQQFHQEDVWNCPASWREHLEDYVGIPGTNLDTNETYADYWRGYGPTWKTVCEDEAEIKAWMTPP